MTHPKITVVTATYNCADTIEESLISVVNQTYDNIEYIIIDGGSTDGTLKIIDKYSKRIANVISEPDMGIYDAINKALDIATGDFLIVIGSDDHLLSWHTIEDAVKKLTDQSHVFYGDVYFEPYNVLHKGKFNKVKRAIWNICHQCIFYPRMVYKKYKYDLKYKLFADDAYNFKISEIYPFVYINVAIAFYAKGGASSHLKDKEWMKVRNKVIIKHCGVFPFLIREIRSLILNKSLSI